MKKIPNGKIKIIIFIFHIINIKDLNIVKDIPTIPIKNQSPFRFIFRFLSSIQKYIPIEISKFKICIMGSELIKIILIAFQIRINI